MEIAIILGVAAVSANIFLFWYAKNYHRRDADEPTKSGSENHLDANALLNTPKVAQLRKSAASELGLSVEELDRMLSKEMKQLHQERKMINLG